MKFDCPDKIKLDFFQAMSILLYVCQEKKKQDRNYTRMLHAVLNKFWKQHPTKQQL